MAANNAIASTQKTGEGDAFVFDNSGANRNIGMLAQQKAQEAGREQQEKLLKQKQDYDTQKQFIDNLTGVNTLGLRTADLPLINEELDAIPKFIDDNKMQGKNPLDISNTKEYMQLQTMMGRLQAKVDASKTWQKQLIAAEQALKQDKDGKLHYDKTMEAIKEGYTRPFNDMVGYNIKPVLAEFSITPRLDKMYGNDLKTLNSQAKVLFDQGAVDDVNKMLADKKQPYIQAAIVAAGPEITEGRITVDKVIEDAGIDFDLKVGKAFYDNNKDVKEKLDERKQDELGDYRKQALAIKQQRANAYTKSVDFATTVQDYGTNEFVSYLEAGTPESDQKFINAFLSSANGIGAGDITKVEKGKGKELFATVPLFDSKMEVIIDKESGNPKTKVIKIRDEFGKYNKKSLANSTVTLIYEASQIKNKTSPVEDLTGDPNNNVVAGTKGANKTSTTNSSSTSSKNTTPLIKTKAEFDALPKGTIYTKVDGKKYKK